jgi:transposase
MWHNSWRLHHDNAPAHSAFRVKEFLAKKNITAVEHPPYLPDLAPIDFFLFPQIKKPIKGEHIDNIDKIKSNMAISLNGILKNYFQACIQSWKTCMQWCIHVEGDYFEADRIQL